MDIAVLVTCYNRVARTLRALDLLFSEAEQITQSRIDVFLVDDASPDGTGAVVLAKFPSVHVIQGTGQLFWNRGMCRAYAAAGSSGKYFGAYLLFNDDVELKPGALQAMIATFVQLNGTAPSVVVGAMCSPTDGRTSYSGLDIDSKYRVMSFRRVSPDGTLRLCDTFNGNCVLVPACAMEDVGGLDPSFHHSYGDIDLGLELGRRGCKTYLMPDHVGYCELNTPKGRPPFRQRLRGMFVPPWPVSDRVHMAFKRFPPVVAMLASAGYIARRTADVFIPVAH